MAQRPLDFWGSLAQLQGYCWNPEVLELGVSRLRFLQRAACRRPEEGPGSASPMQLGFWSQRKRRAWSSTLQPCKSSLQSLCVHRLARASENASMQLTLNCFLRLCLWFFNPAPPMGWWALNRIHWHKMKRRRLSLKKRASPRWQGASERSNSTSASLPALEPPLSKLPCPRLTVVIPPAPTSPISCCPGEQATPPPGISSLSSSLASSSSTEPHIGDLETHVHCNDSCTLVTTTVNVSSDCKDDCQDTLDEVTTQPCSGTAVDTLSDPQIITDPLSWGSPQGKTNGPACSRSSQRGKLNGIKTDPHSWGNQRGKTNGIKKQTTLFSFMTSKSSSGKTESSKLDAKSQIGKTEKFHPETSTSSSSSSITPGPVDSTKRSSRNKTCPFYKKIPGNSFQNSRL